LDYKNCGLCGNECPGDAQGRVNADPVCTSSQCGITCRATYGDCDNNKANGCEASLVAYFVDADGDGIGVKVASPAGFACAPPPGNATTNTDCNDDPMHDGKDVFPGQTRYFAVGYTTAMGTSSYDYNCDTVESVEGAQIGKCTPCSPGSAADSVHAASPYCGSTTALVCNSAVCASQSHAAWRCH
jgi:hypothetical protein